MMKFCFCCLLIYLSFFHSFLFLLLNSVLVYVFASGSWLSWALALICTLLHWWRQWLVGGLVSTVWPLGELYQTDTGSGHGVRENRERGFFNWFFVVFVQCLLLSSLSLCAMEWLYLCIMLTKVFLFGTLKWLKSVKKVFAAAGVILYM